MEDRAHYGLFASLFEYPERDFPAQVERIAAALGPEYGQALESLLQFAAQLPVSPSADGTLTEPELDQARELFTRSFDVQSTTTLDVGYTMFGDDYKRGELMVNLRRELREAGVDCGSELPDHLPTVLRLMACWRDSELATEFAQEILHPVLEKMIVEFSGERIQQRNRLYKKHYKTLIDSSPDRQTMYVHALKALQGVLSQDFELTEREVPQQTRDFLSSVAQELAIEERGAGERPADQSMRSLKPC